VSRQDFRRDINRTFDDISGPPSPALSARVRSALTEKGPVPTGPIWMAGLAAALIAAVVVGVLVVTNFNRHQISFVPGGVTTASPSPAPSASPSATPSGSPIAKVDSPAGPYSCVATGTSSGQSNPSAPAIVFVNAVRTGTHAGYDQVTIQFSNGQPSDIRLVTQANANFTQGASGQPVTLAGQYGILITIRGADGHTQYSGPADFKTNYAVLSELRQVQDFEGTVQWALGLKHSACYAYTILTNPTRLVLYIQQ
jgi:hypothetical protein